MDLIKDIELNEPYRIFTVKTYSWKRDTYKEFESLSEAINYLYDKGRRKNSQLWVGDKDDVKNHLYFKKPLIDFPEAYDCNSTSYKIDLENKLAVKYGRYYRLPDENMIKEHDILPYGTPKTWNLIDYSFRGMGSNSFSMEAVFYSNYETTKRIERNFTEKEIWDKFKDKFDPYDSENSV